jgi:hypothetical protein
MRDGCVVKSGRRRRRGVLGKKKWRGNEGRKGVDAEHDEAGMR